MNTDPPIFPRISYTILLNFSFATAATFANRVQGAFVFRNLLDMVLEFGELGTIGGKFGLVFLVADGELAEYVADHAQDEQNDLDPLGRAGDVHAEQSLGAAEILNSELEIVRGCVFFFFRVFRCNHLLSC